MTKRTWSELDTDIDYHSYSPLPKKSCTSWNCIFCDCNNHTSLNICKSCKSWICKQCKIINPRYENLCTQCNRPPYATNPVSKTTTAISKWKCIRCTLDNDNNRHICAICNTPKPIKKKTKPTIQKAEWQCKSCTLINKLSNSHCEACGHPRRTNKPIPQLSPIERKRSESLNMNNNYNNN
eukprot:32634_1